MHRGGAQPPRGAEIDGISPCQGTAGGRAVKVSTTVPPARTRSRTGLPRHGASFGPSARPPGQRSRSPGWFAPPLWLLIVVSARLRRRGVWIVLASTDGLDGYLARRHGTTRSGAFLDPLADKARCSAHVGHRRAEGLVVRSRSSRARGRHIGVRSYGVAGGWRCRRPSGQGKTVVQSVAVGLACCGGGGRRFVGGVRTLWAAVALTLGTGSTTGRGQPGHPAGGGRDRATEPAS